VTTYTKPLPSPDPDTKEFWAACQKHRLIIQRCLSCKSLRWPPRQGCPFCTSQEMQWEEVSGKGTVYSYIVFRRPFLSEFTRDIPYVVAIVELDESPKVRMLSNIVGCTPEAVHIGMRVKAVYEDVTDQVTLFKFAPAAEPATR